MGIKHIALVLALVPGLAAGQAPPAEKPELPAEAVPPELQRQLPKKKKAKPKRRRPRPAAPRPAAAVPPRHSDGIVADLGEGVVIDWTAGRLVVAAVGPADLRAPNVGIARAGSERIARQWATTRILAAVAKVPTVPGLALARVDKPKDWDLEYFSDGSTRLELEIRLALLSPGKESPPVAPLVVDARHLPLAPALGLTVVAGGTRYAGPTTFTDKPEPRAMRARGEKDGLVTVEGDERKVAQAAKQGAPVVFVINRKP